MKKLYYIFTALFCMSGFASHMQAQECNPCEEGCGWLIAYEATYDNGITPIVCGVPTPTHATLITITVTMPEGYLPDSLVTGWSSPPFLGQTIVLPTGGSSVITYTWNLSGFPNLGNIALWAVSADEGNGCYANAVCVGTENRLPLTVSISVIQPDCGDGVGSLFAVPVGGQWPYVYSWTTPDGEVFENYFSGWWTATPGTYTVTITDANGCTATASDVVNNPPAPVAAALWSTDPTCDENNGALLVVSLPTPHTTTAYTYVWSNGATTQGQTDLSPGAYTVTVSNGVCTTVLFATLQNVGSAEEVRVDTISCTPIMLPWGDTAAFSGTYTASMPTVNPCGSVQVWNVTISDVLVGDTTRAVLCGGSMQWMGDSYSEAGFYTATDNSGNCPIVRALDIRVLDHTSSVVIHNETCVERPDEIVLAVTQDGCLYDSVFVWDLIPMTMTESEYNTCSLSAITLERDSITPEGCIITITSNPHYVGSPDSTRFEAGCRINMESSTQILQNQYGCSYTMTTKYLPVLYVKVVPTPSCDPDLIGLAVLSDTIYGSCDTLVYHSYYQPASDIAILDISACEGEVVSLPGIYIGVATTDTTIIQTLPLQGVCKKTWILNIHITTPGFVERTEDNCDPFAQPYMIPGADPCTKDTLVIPRIQFGAIGFATVDTCALLAPIIVTTPVPGGCDSTTLVTFNWDPDIEYFDLFTCDESFRDSVKIDTIYDSTTGCSSLRRTSWTIRLSDTTTLQPLTLCPGEEFLWEGDGESYIANEGTLSFIGQNQEGCDSIITQEIRVYDVQNRDTTIQLCYGDSLKLWNTGIFGRADWRDTTIVSTNPMTGCIEQSTIHMIVSMPDTTNNIEYICDIRDWYQPISVYYPHMGDCGRVVTWEASLERVLLPIAVFVRQPECDENGNPIPGDIFLANWPVLPPVEWFYNGISLGEVQNPSNLEPGVYGLQISNGYCDIDTSFVLYEPQCGEVADGECRARITPNPVLQGQTPLLELQGFGKKVKVRVYSMDGKLQVKYKFTYNGPDIEGFPLVGFPKTQGIYVVHVEDNKGHDLEGIRIVRN